MALVRHGPYWEDFTKAGKETSVTGMLEPTNTSVNIKDLISLKGYKGEDTRMDSEYSKKNIEQLAKSIKKHGFIEPIMVFVEKDGSATIGEGNHRIRASKIAGVTEIPTEIKWFGNSNKNPSVWGRKYINKYKQQYPTQNSLDKSAKR